MPKILVPVLIILGIAALLGLSALFAGPWADRIKKIADTLAWWQRILAIVVVAVLLGVVTIVGNRATAAPSLKISIPSQDFVCDGIVRKLGLLSGAQPGEGIEIKSNPKEADLKGGTADEKGQLVLHWVCGQTGIGTPWLLSFKGEISGRAGSVTVTGVEVGTKPSTSTSTSTSSSSSSSTAVQPPSGPMVASVSSSPFVCDGVKRAIGTLTGAAPNEQVTFASPGVTDFVPGSADGSGRLGLNWVCDPADAGTTWSVTATGTTSGKTATFTVTAAGP